MLCEGWEKGWWASLSLERKKTTLGLTAPGHPPAGTALRVPFRQVRLIYEHMHSAWRCPWVQMSVSLCAPT